MSNITLQDKPHSIEDLDNIAQSLSMPWKQMCQNMNNSISALNNIIIMIGAIQASPYFATYASQDEMTYFKSLITYIQDFITNLPVNPDC